jgi:hypothetical protein
VVNLAKARINIQPPQQSILGFIDDNWELIDEGSYQFINQRSRNGLTVADAVNIVIVVYLSKQLIHIEGRKTGVRHHRSKAQEATTHKWRSDRRSAVEGHDGWRVTWSYTDIVARFNLNMTELKVWLLTTHTRKVSALTCLGALGVPLFKSFCDTG